VKGDEVVATSPVMVAGRGWRPVLVSSELMSGWQDDVFPILSQQQRRSLAARRGPQSNECPQCHRESPPSENYCEIDGMRLQRTNN
jgi:hypothetical protein